MLPEAAMKILGLMTPAELGVLCRMARSARVIAELGCYKGRSLAAMGLTNPTAKLHGIDAFGDMSHRGYEGSTQKATQANLKKAGVKAKLHIGKTNEVAPAFKHKLDLLHIDAGHSYEECSQDLADWAPKVNPGGAVCVHDYGKARKEVLDRPEVQQAVDDWRNDDWAEVERFGTMIAFRHLVADEGVLYVAYGEKARELVQNSIHTLRRQSGRRYPVAVVSDTPMKGADINIIHIEADPGARTQKTRIYALSPFRRTLYLDADTELLHGPEAGFGLLDYSDVVLAQDFNRAFSKVQWKTHLPEEKEMTKKEIGTAEVMYYNSGVFFFRRNDRIQAMMQEWHQQWLRWQKHDQMALLRAIHKHPVKIVPMRESWNTHRRHKAEFVFHNHRSASRAEAPK